MSAPCDLFSMDSGQILSPIKDFYCGKNVFLTGCTGVVGEVILEKLLRCETNRVYVLCRAKKGVSAQDRLAKVFETALFEKLTSIKPNFMERIHVIYGDIRSIGLALSPVQRTEILNEVDIVIHLAANVSFDQKFSEIILTNVRGTREMLTLARQMKKLLAFAYCSTAFSNCNRFDIEEKFYRTPIEANEAIRLAEYFSNTNDGVMDVLTERLIAPWPNVYTFSKAIAENLIEHASNELKITLIRPSIVLPTRTDPIPGYGTNLYGLTGYLAAGFVGMMRVQVGSTLQRTCIVCVDDVSNGTLVAIWDRCQEQAEQNVTKIFNMTYKNQSLSQGEIVQSMRIVSEEAPLEQTVFVPLDNLTNNVPVVFLLKILYEFLPGFILDCYLKLVISKKRVLPLFRKAVNFTVVLGYFTSNDWNMSNKNLTNLWQRMSVTDREFFPCDLDGFVWKDFVPHYWFGIKKYIMKESMDPKRLAKAKSKRFKIKCIYYGFICVWCAAMFGLAYYYGSFVPLALCWFYPIM